MKLSSHISNEKKNLNENLPPKIGKDDGFMVQVV